MIVGRSRSVSRFRAGRPLAIIVRFPSRLRGPWLPSLSSRCRRVHASSLGGLGLWTSFVRILSAALLGRTGGSRTTLLRFQMSVFGSSCAFSTKPASTTCQTSGVLPVFAALRRSIRLTSGPSRSCVFFTGLGRLAGPPTLLLGCMLLRVGPQRRLRPACRPQHRPREVF